VARGESTGTVVEAASDPGDIAGVNAVGNIYVGLEGVILAVFVAVVARFSTIYALLLRLAPARAPSSPSNEPSQPQLTPADQPTQSRAPGKIEYTQLPMGTIYSEVHTRIRSTRSLMASVRLSVHFP